MTDLERELKVIPAEYYKCPICAQDYESKEEAEACMRKPFEKPLPRGTVFRERREDGFGGFRRHFIVRANTIDFGHNLEHELKVVYIPEPKYPEDHFDSEHKDVYEIKREIRKGNYEFLELEDFELFRANNINLILKMRKERGIPDFLRTADISFGGFAFGSPEHRELLKGCIATDSFPMDRHWKKIFKYAKIDF